MRRDLDQSQREIQKHQGEITELRNAVHAREGTIQSMKQDQVRERREMEQERRERQRLEAVCRRGGGAAGAGVARPQDPGVVVEELQSSSGLSAAAAHAHQRSGGVPPHQLTPGRRDHAVPPHQLTPGRRDHAVAYQAVAAHQQRPSSGLLRAPANGEKGPLNGSLHSDGRRNAAGLLGRPLSARGNRAQQQGGAAAVVPAPSPAAESSTHPRSSPLSSQDPGGPGQHPRASPTAQPSMIRPVGHARHAGLLPRRNSGGAGLQRAPSAERNPAERNPPVRSAAGVQQPSFRPPMRRPGSPATRRPGGSGSAASAAGGAAGAALPGRAGAPSGVGGQGTAATTQMRRPGQTKVGGGDFGNAEPQMIRHPQFWQVEVVLVDWEFVCGVFQWCVVIGRRRARELPSFL